MAFGVGEVVLWIEIAPIVVALQILIVVTSLQLPNVCYFHAHQGVYLMASSYVPWLIRWICPKLGIRCKNYIYVGLVKDMQECTECCKVHRLIVCRIIHTRICSEVVHPRLMKEQFNFFLQACMGLRQVPSKHSFLIRINCKFTHISNFCNISIFFVDENDRKKCLGMEMMYENY